MKCSEPDLNAELSRTDIAPVVLRGELSNVTPESAWYKPLKGPGFQVRPQRHSAGSFTPPLPVAGQDLILLADQDDKGFLINLHVCNATIFKADDAALAILRQHFPTLYE